MQSDGTTAIQGAAGDVVRLTVDDTGADLVVSTEVERAEVGFTVTVSLTNLSDAAIAVRGPSPVALLIPWRPSAIGAFTSSWGLEYEPVVLSVEEPQTIEVSTGRSAQGHSPWLLVEGESAAYVVAPHWSGNWAITTEPVTDAIRVVVGLAPDDLTVELQAQGTMELPSVSVGFGPSATLAARGLAARALSRRPAGPPLLTEWNHWWPYEDQEINEDVFLANAEIAAGLGLEVAVLDAGWFGGSAVDSDWTAERGDWHKVNTTRFPSGLAWLADETRRRGIDFGIWIEAEAVGRGADLQRLHPEFMAVAHRDGGPEPLGYVCLGSPEAAAYIAGTVRQLILTTGARWIKWDFNLDPGLGCDRSDHGHRSGEGLIRHYEGLYQVLDELRSAFPDTVFEACSSGGLRIDLGLAEHVDCLFLSDPDWTEHHLACLWGACQMLPPRQILHWVQSEWRGEHRFQHADYSGSLMTAAQFDLKVQSAMLHRFGISVRLTEMRADLRERLAHHVQTYKTRIRGLLDEGLLWPLNAQPLREEKGNRRPAFQLTSGDDHLVAAFRLAPAGDWEPVRPVGLDPDAAYAVSVLDLDGQEIESRGRVLMSDGIPLPVGGASTLVLLRRI